MKQIKTDYSVTHSIKLKILESIMEVKVPAFTYSLLTNCPRDSSKITTKPWTTLFSNFLLDEGNKDILEMLKNRKIKQKRDVFELARQTRNMLRDFDKHRKIFSGLRTCAPKDTRKEEIKAKKGAKARRKLDFSKVPDDKEDDGLDLDCIPRYARTTFSPKPKRMRRK